MLFAMFGGGVCTLNDVASNTHGKIGQFRVLVFLMNILQGLTVQSCYF